MNAPINLKYGTTQRDIEATKDRLENWKHWARDHRKYRITPSLEGRYRAPPSWHPPEAKIFVDINDALKVEKVLVGLPIPYKQIIIYKYIHPFLNFQAFCRKAHIRAGEYDAMERKATDMVHNRLMRAEIFIQDVA